MWGLLSFMALCAPHRCQGFALAVFDPRLERRGGDPVHAADLHDGDSALVDEVVCRPLADSEALPELGDGQERPVR